jgi:hypothetical protein
MQDSGYGDKNQMAFPEHFPKFFVRRVFALLLNRLRLDEMWLSDCSLPRNEEQSVLVEVLHVHVLMRDEIMRKKFGNETCTRGSFVNNGAF